MHMQINPMTDGRGCHSFYYLEYNTGLRNCPVVEDK